MASTNKTTHLELSQYVGSDKPTYLTDYNGDMAKIDQAVYGNSVSINENAEAIGDLSNLDTTTKTNIVAAINEVKTDIPDYSNTIGDLTNLSTSTKTNIVAAINEVDGNCDTNASNIGNLLNLSTDTKNNLVGAINEVDSHADQNDSHIGTLTNLNTTTKTNMVAAINEVKSNIDNINLIDYTDYTVANSKLTGTNCSPTGDSKITVAKNSDGSLAKIYGKIIATAGGTGDGNNYINLVGDTGLRPSSQIDIYPAGICLSSTGTYNYPQYLGITINTNGTVTLKTPKLENNSNITCVIFPCLYYIKDFGDVNPSA